MIQHLYLYELERICIANNIPQRLKTRVTYRLLTLLSGVSVTQLKNLCCIAFAGRFFDILAIKIICTLSEKGRKAVTGMVPVHYRY